MSVETDKLIITEVLGATGLNSDGTVGFLIDEIDDLTIANTEGKEAVTGKGGKTLLNIKKDKKTIVTLINKAYSMSVMEYQTGGTLKNGLTNEGEKTRIRFPEGIEIKVADKATISHKAVGTIGNEIAEIFLMNADGSLGKKFTQSATLATGKFTFTPATKTIEFFAGEVPFNSDITVYYDRDIMMKSLNNPIENYSKSCPMWIDVLCKDTCQKVYWGRYIFAMAEFDGNFDIKAGSTIGTQSISFESLPPSGKCPGVVVTGKNLWDFQVFGVEDGDAV